MQNHSGPPPLWRQPHGRAVRLEDFGVLARAAPPGRIRLVTVQPAVERLSRQVAEALAAEHQDTRPCAGARAMNAWPTRLVASIRLQPGWPALRRCVDTKPFDQQEAQSRKGAP